MVTHICPAKIMGQGLTKMQKMPDMNELCRFFSSEKQKLTSCPFLFISFKPFLKKTIAPRGPRSDLCVVVVTMSAYSKGDGMTPAATNPLICAISASMIAFCLSQTYWINIKEIA